MERTVNELEVYKKLAIIQSRLVAPKNQFNSFGKYNYRSCEDILEGLKSLLKELNCALLMSDEVMHIGDRYYIKATAMLIDADSGKTVLNTAYAREEESKKGMDGSQVTGASSSYARKYALNGLFAIDDTKDADGLPKSEEPKPEAKKAPDNVKPIKENTKDQVKPACKRCKAEIPQNVHDFSIKKYKQPLCFECQKAAKAADAAGYNKGA